MSDTHKFVLNPISEQFLYFCSYPQQVIIIYIWILAEKYMNEVASILQRFVSFAIQQALIGGGAATSK